MDHRAGQEVLSLIQMIYGMWSVSLNLETVSI